MSVVGFDIGNQTCYIAVARSGGIEVIDNEYSLRATPSVIGFTSKSREIGITAKSKIIPNLKNTVFGFKTLLGKKYYDSMKELTYLPTEICEMPYSYLGVSVNYLNKQNTFSIQQIMAMLLTKLKSLAEAKLGITVRECVISVPMFYTDTQRRFMLDAAEIAGLKPLKLINESTAAALFYGFYRQEHFEEPKTVVFVDLGDSALTATACEFSNGKLKVLGSVWNTGVGGRDFDLVLVKHFLRDIETRYNLNIIGNKKALMQLVIECENLKKQMSVNSRNLELCVECIMNDTDIRGQMNRLEFEKLSSPLFDTIECTLKELLTKTGLKIQTIFQVQVIGAACRIPALKNIIYEVFGQDPLTTLNMDETVARGCALQCAILSPTLKTKDFIIEDIQPYDILIRTRPDEQLNLFPLFHQVPASKMLTVPYKPGFSVEAFYNDISVHSEIAKVEFSNFPPDVKESSDAKIKVKICLNEHGILDVTSAKVLMKQKEPNTEDSSNSSLVPFTEGDTDPPSSQENSEAPPEEQKKAVPREKIKSFDLMVDAIIPTLPRNELYSLCEKEHEMINVDIDEKRMADLRNMVEEQVYGIRGKLNEELKDFATEEQKTQIVKYLDETEDWIYDYENPKEDDYYQKLDDLKTLIKPVQKKYVEFQDLMDVLHSYQNFLEESSDLFNKLNNDKKYSHVEKAKKDQLAQKLHQEANSFHVCMCKMLQINKCLELPLKASDIRESLNALHREIQDVISVPPVASNEALEATAAEGDASATVGEEQKPNTESPVDGEDIPGH